MRQKRMSKSNKKMNELDLFRKQNEENIYLFQKDCYTISTDPNLLDIDLIHSFVSQSYWARGIPRKLVVRSICHSFCFGLYERRKQIGFARLVTDFATEAELCELFVVEPYQGRGLGKWLIECVISCPSLEGIRTLSLGTADSHYFYKKVGFHVVGECPNRMQILYDRPWYIPSDSISGA